MVSETPIKDVVPGHVYMHLPEDLRDGDLHGLATAAVDESVLLHGPPGAGKSTESLGRLAGYTGENDLDPTDMTLATYRKALAAGVSQRVKSWNIFPEADWVDSENDPAKWMGTGHAICIRSSGFLSRVNEDRSEHAGMVDGQAMYAFCDEHNIQYKASNPHQKSVWERFHDLYTYCKCNLIDVGEWRHVPPSELKSLQDDEIAYRTWVEFEEETGASFRSLVQTWESWKQEHDCHDYYEQLESGLADGALPGTEFVIVDELHDAYPLMSRVFEKWIDAADTVVVAGDPHQVCNAFSGSHPGIFTGLNTRVDRDLPVIGLPESHRVPDEHYAAAARVLDEYHTPPVLETAGQGVIREHEPARQMEIYGDDGWSLMPYEAAGNPAKLYDEYGEDIMFLARTQLLCDGVGACLDAGGVIYQSQPGVAGNWTDRLTLMHALQKLERSDGPTGLAIDEARLLLKHTDERLLDGSRSDVLSELKELERQQDRGEHPGSGVPAARMTDWVSAQWWAAMGQGQDSIENLVYLDPQHGFSQETGRDVIAMQRAWDRYDDGSQWGSFPNSPRGVETKLWTIHAAKGDEADHTVVYTGVTGRVRDSVQAYEDQAANEARTWYVALTRAKQSLHIVRNAFDVTVNDYQQLPDDLVTQARRAAAAQRRNTASSNGGEPA